MEDLVKKLLLLAAQNPDGFTLVLPDGSLAEISWLYGIKEARTPKGNRIVSRVFGVILKIGESEAIIVLHEEKEDNSSQN
jgi:hypothetical protein